MLPVILVDQSDGNTLETGVTQSNLNIEVSKAGGAQASGTGTWTERGDGEYYYTLGTTEVNTNGVLVVRFQKTGIREFKAKGQVVGFNPYQTFSTQSSVNAVPTQTEINVSVWGALPANVAVQTDINNLNDPTSSAINAVIETAHGAGSYAGTSSTVINSIVNAQGLEVQSLINALNDPTPSEINAVITTAHGAGSYVGGGGQTTYNAVIANQSILNQNQSLINNLDVDIAALNDPTPSAINAVITTAHGAGSYVGAGGNTVVNLLNDIQTDTNTAIPNLINGLNDPTPSEINAVIETAHGAGSYAGTSSTVINSIVNAQGLEVQSLINGLNDLSTTQVQSIVNAQGLETQSLINGLNDLSTTQVQSIINAHESNIQSDLNAMNVKLIRIEGQNGLYLVGEYSYNSSDINTKIEFWQYSSQTDMNNHQTVNNINKWQGDVTLTGQLASIIKFGDHA